MSFHAANIHTSKLDCLGASSGRDEMVDPNKTLEVTTVIETVASQQAYSNHLHASGAYCRCCSCVSPLLTSFVYQ